MSSLKTRLLPLSKESLDLYRHWRNDYDTYKWCRQREPLSVAEHEAWFHSLPHRSDIKMYEIVGKDMAIGVCGLTSIDWVNSHAEFSLYIGAGHKGEGYGESALRALLLKAFLVHNLNLIWGESFDGNPAIEMFLKIGFKKTGTRRQFYYREGKYLDAHIFDITKKEFLSDD